MTIFHQNDGTVINTNKEIRIRNEELGFLTITPPIFIDEETTRASISYNGTLEVNNVLIGDRVEVSIDGSISDSMNVTQVLKNKTIKTTQPKFLEFEVVGNEQAGLTNSMIFRYVSHFGSKYYYEGRDGNAGFGDTSIFTKYLLVCNHSYPYITIEKVLTQTEAWTEN